MKLTIMGSILAAAAALMIAGCGGSSSTAPSQNAAPIANAGNAQSVVAGATVNLSASGSSDPNGDPLTYSWALSSVPTGSAATLTGLTSASPSFVPDRVGTYVATLIVNDGKMNSTPVTVTITAGTVVGFDSLTPLPPNMPSISIQASYTPAPLVSLGDTITLKPGSPHTLNNISVAMSSWACQTGGWSTNDCVSSPGSVFSVPITLKVYDSNGNLLATQTPTFSIPYRPSADPACTGANAGKWQASNGTCYNGFASEITFDLASLKVTLPGDAFSYVVSYNTDTHGAMPTGVTGPVDSLNIGVYNLPATPSVGSETNPGYLLWNGASVSEGAGIMAQVQLTGP